MFSASELLEKVEGQVSNTHGPNCPHTSTIRSFPCFYCQSEKVKHTQTDSKVTSFLGLILSCKDHFCKSLAIFWSKSGPSLYHDVFEASHWSRDKMRFSVMTSGKPLNNKAKPKSKAQWGAWVPNYEMNLRPCANLLATSWWPGCWILKSLQPFRESMSLLGLPYPLEPLLLLEETFLLWRNGGAVVETDMENWVDSAAKVSSCEEIWSWINQIGSI